MGYHIDLSTITIDQYKEQLKTEYLPPSRMILKEQLQERFNFFKSIEIQNVKQLLLMLKKKDNWAKLLASEYFSENYLTILLRELNSNLPKPNKLKDFAGISDETIAKLENIGIRNTEQLYEKILNKTQRQQLAQATGIDETEIIKLAKLTDLSRIKWVGATFARILYNLGIDTVEKAAHSNPEELHLKINTYNKEMKIYRGQIGLNDVRILINAAKATNCEIEY